MNNTKQQPGSGNEGVNTIGDAPTFTQKHPETDTGIGSRLPEVSTTRSRLNRLAPYFTAASIALLATTCMEYDPYPSAEEDAESQQRVDLLAFESVRFHNNGVEISFIPRKSATAVTINYEGKHPPGAPLAGMIPTDGAFSIKGDMTDVNKIVLNADGQSQKFINNRIAKFSDKLPVASIQMN